MSTNASSVSFPISHRASAAESAPSAARTGALVLAGRLLFAFIFIFAGLNHFAPQTIAFAASQGVPLASLAVPLSGVLSIAGGLSILLGYRPDWGRGSWWCS